MHVRSILVSACSLRTFFTAWVTYFVWSSRRAGSAVPRWWSPAVPTTHTSQTPSQAQAARGPEHTQHIGRFRQSGRSGLARLRPTVRQRWVDLGPGSPRTLASATSARRSTSVRIKSDRLRSTDTPSSMLRMARWLAGGAM